MNRTKKIQFYASEREAEDLSNKAALAAMPKARLLRMLIAGYNPPPAPDDRFFEAMNLVAHFCGAIESFALTCSDEEKVRFIEKQAKEWATFQQRIEERYLLPERRDIHWQ